MRERIVAFFRKAKALSEPELILQLMEKERRRAVARRGPSRRIALVWYDNQTQTDILFVVVSRIASMNLDSK